MRKVLFLGVALITGCATYQPPNLPPDRLATVAAIENRTGDQAFFDQIDGLSPSVASALQLSVSKRAVMLEPGKHTLRIRVRLGTAEGLMTVWLLAEPGRTYYIRHSSSGYKFTVWVEDDTGMKVGGLVGSADEPS